MGKALGVLAAIALLFGLYIVSVVISAIATAIGNVIGLLVVLLAVVAWVAICWSGYRRNRQAKKSGVGK